MEWMIYTLLGVGIIVLLTCIVYLASRKRFKRITEGALDYFDIDEYIQSMTSLFSPSQNATIGRYIHIIPNQEVNLDFDGNALSDGIASISQVAVYDMNGNNIALKKPVYASVIEDNSQPVSSIVDGVMYPRKNVFHGRDYVEIDLGDVYQISSIRFIGEADSSGSASRKKLLEGRIRGLVFQVLLTAGEDNNQEVFKYILDTSDVDQTIDCPNSFNLERTVTDPSVSPNNPNLITFDYAQKEVFSLETNTLRTSAEMVCNGLGATLATVGQLSYAQKNGAHWCNAGWVKDSTQTIYYPLQGTNPSCSGGASINPKRITSSSQRANVNCFGVKPSRESNVNIQPFQINSDWSMYDRTISSIQPYFGNTTINIPDVRYIKQFVDYNYLPIRGLSSEWWFVFTVISEVKSSMTTTTPTDDEDSPVSRLTPLSDPSRNPFYEVLLRGSPLNFLYEVGDTILRNDKTGRTMVDIKVYGNASAKAISDVKDSLSLARRLYLGSVNDVDKFVNIRYAEMDLNKPNTNWLKAAHMRADTGYVNVGGQGTTRFCRSELVQKIDTATQQYKTVQNTTANIGFNTSYCSTPITTDMLGLIPDPARNFLINWIYNRTKRYIRHFYGISYNDDGKAYDKTSTVTPRPLLTDAQISAALSTMNKHLEELPKLVPTVNGQPISIDITSKSTLDSIAQAFYETLGGAYIMSLIYDVYTIGGTIIDIRFDLTKHSDISDIRTKIAEIKSDYYNIRSSNVTQDILDKAKETYEKQLANLQEQSTSRVNSPITGVLGRFFYTYDVATALFNIDGFTLDARAVTSFIPELNGGIYTATGGDPGWINYAPKIKYTMNIPEPLDCSNQITLRRIMEDYVTASQSDLAPTLIHAKPSMDTSQGVIQIKQILGSEQVSKTQCAITWKETLWDDDANVPISKNTTDITRNAIISYTNGIDDWFTSTIVFDVSGFKFLDTNTIPQCKFDPGQFQITVSPNIDTLDPVTEASKIKNYFLGNAFNNGLSGFPCNDAIPRYKFSVDDYLAANSDLDATYNSGDMTNTKGAIDHYRLTGINENRIIRKSQKINPYADVDIITIQQPMPVNNELDNASKSCPTTSCDDLDVIYTIIDQYNNDPTSPGAIMLVTRANTANPYQCDLEVNINYDSTVVNSMGKVVQKGSFKYDKNGNEIESTKEIPTGTAIGDTLALNVHMDSSTCKFIYDGTDGPGSGTSIFVNTPALYKPLEYTKRLLSNTLIPVNKTINTLTDVISNAVQSATSLFSTYRTNTFATVGGIANLGDCPTAKCSDTANLNAMLAFYKTKALPDKQINKILRVGTLDSTTCDITFQEDTLGASTGSSRSVTISQTSALRFTMAADTEPCTFKIKSMSPLLPAPPAGLFDLSNNPNANTSACNEVFYIDTTISQKDATKFCSSYNAAVATKSQLISAQLAGADWCSPGWVADISGTAFSPGCSANGPGSVSPTSGAGGSGSGAGGSGSQTLATYTKTSAGVNCFGTKPDKEVPIDKRNPCPNPKEIPLTFQGNMSPPPINSMPLPYTRINNDTCKQTCPSDWFTYGAVEGGCWKTNPEVLTINASDMKTLPISSSTCPPSSVFNTYYSGSGPNPMPTITIPYIFNGTSCVQTCPTGWNEYSPDRTGCWKSFGLNNIVAINNIEMKTLPGNNPCPSQTSIKTNYSGGIFTVNPMPNVNVPYTVTPTQCIQNCPTGWVEHKVNGSACKFEKTNVILIKNKDMVSIPAIKTCPDTHIQIGDICTNKIIRGFKEGKWNQTGACTNTTVDYVNPSKEGFATYGPPIQVTESSFPLNKISFGNDHARNSDSAPLDSLYVEPLRQKVMPETGPKYVNVDEPIKPEKPVSYRYIRFRPIQTRNPLSETVNVGKFRFFLGPNDIDMRNAKVTNPMGTWVGDIDDVVGRDYRNGWSDSHKKAIVFAFPYAILMNGFTWTTANPEKGIDGDPVQWKLEGSTNGVFWVTLRNQTNHNYPVPKERFQELPIFRF